MNLPENTGRGLSDDEVLLSRKEHGRNALDVKHENTFFQLLKSLVAEPMVVLLLTAAAIYFISGDTGDGFFLAGAIILVAAISLYQDKKSRNALAQLKAYNTPKSKVIRNGAVTEIKSEDVVVGDSLIAEEGKPVTADGIVTYAHDFFVNESVLTGEALPVAKEINGENDHIYSGTTVTGGLGIATVTAVGNETQLGKIGRALESITEEKTPLEIQINAFVKKMVVIGAIVFFIVWALNYARSYQLLDSLLKALTLAMSILPEEIPVAFTTFMVLGAWRLMKMGIIVKQMKTVETLGSATVICTDKTGTLTENRMSLAKLYTPAAPFIADADGSLDEHAKELVRIAMWASEPVPFDPMEIAIHEAYTRTAINDERAVYAMLHEYPLSGRPPMMTHIFENAEGKRIIAAKGAPEAILRIAALPSITKQAIEKVVDEMTAEGFRVLAVAESHFDGKDFPEQQQSLPFLFTGLVAFYDPPKQNIARVLQDLYHAGIQVKIITGDGALTTAAIARQIGFTGFDKSISGDDVMQLTDEDMQHAAAYNQVFTRMFPEAKLKVIQALKARGEIVAMTGDGVNDSPALKAAHIGIAMGRKGTESAKQAAALVLVEDDLSKIVTAVAMGRRIYTNLKKAIRYIISIHVPIILTVFIPLALHWVYPNIFTPVHVIFLELIMGPTCSIVYENEPAEKHTMQEKPRPVSTTFFQWNELITSIVQGLVITAGALGILQFAIRSGYDEHMARSMVFTTIIIANIILTLVNRSFVTSFLASLIYPNNLMIIISCVTVLITALLLYIPPLAAFFGLAPLSLKLLALCGLTGFLSVTWYEIVKLVRRRCQHKTHSPG